MDQRLTQEQPTALIVSHCVPDAVGTPDRARAWQLLRLTARTHRVYLACVLDRPVNLAQWRIVQQQTQQLAIQQSFLWPRLAHQWLGWLDGRSAQRVLAHTNLTQPIEQWAGDQPFDAVVCTHPALWPQAQPIQANRRVCDLPASSARRRRRTHNRRSRRHYPNQHLIESQCSHVTLNRSTDQHLFTHKPCQTMVIPTAIDPHYFITLRHTTPQAPQAQAELGLALHCDWDRPHAHRVLSWFQRQIWPTVKRVVPQAQLWVTRPAAADPYTSLANATVVVCPDSYPAFAKLPVCQALAMQRAVVACEPAIHRLDLGLRHGQQLLLSKRRRDWIAHCVQLLRSQARRRHLIGGANAFLNRYATTDQSGDALTQALRGLDPHNHPISRAA